MNYEKLKRLAILIGVIIIVILIATNCEKKEDLETQQQSFKEHQDVPTTTPFDISEVEEDGIARDYTNPTDEEEEEAYALYGKNGCYFDEKGLHIKHYEAATETLRTQLILEEYDFVKTIPLPDEKKVEYYEYEENAFRIFLKKISKKEMEDYLKKIKETYKYTVTITETGVMYKAVSEEGHRVTVSYNNSNEKGLFDFRIAKPQEETM